MEHHWTDGGMRDGLVVAGITENNKEGHAAGCLVQHLCSGSEGV